MTYQKAFVTTFQADCLYGQAQKSLGRVKKDHFRDQESETPILPPLMPPGPRDHMENPVAVEHA